MRYNACEWQFTISKELFNAYKSNLQERYAAGLEVELAKKAGVRNAAVILDGIRCIVIL